MAILIEQVVVQMREHHIGYREACAAFRRAWLEQALKQNGKNQCTVADEIGVHRNTLSRAIRDLGVQIPDGRKQFRRG